MKCDLCDKEATVHEWTKKAGQKVEKHLCEECARKQGVAIQPQQQISQLITQLIGAAKPGTPQAQLNPTVQVGACPTCGTTYAQFRHSGLLGCPHCYQVFEAQLSPLLQRAHEGGTHHAGKVPYLPPRDPADPPIAPSPPPPPSAPGRAHPVAAESMKAAPHKQAPVAGPVAQPPTKSADAARAEQIKRLRTQLNQAVAAEQYEKAAALRDELAKIESAAPGPRSPSSGGKPTP